MRRDGPSTLLIPAANLELLLDEHAATRGHLEVIGNLLTIDRWHHLVSASAAAGRRQLR